MRKPQPGSTKDKLPELLDPEQQNVLIKRYYETTKTTLNEWLAKSLALESGEWVKEDEPIGDEHGYFFTDLPIILYNMITEMLTVAKKISNELKDQVFAVIVEEMKNFGTSYARELNKFKLKVCLTMVAFYYIKIYIFWLVVFLGLLKTYVTHHS